MARLNELGKSAALYVGDLDDHYPSALQLASASITGASTSLTPTRMSAAPLWAKETQR